MKTNRVVAAATFGVIGVLALGACSSNASDQAQDASPSQASSSPSEREAAKPDNSKAATTPTAGPDPLAGLPKIDGVTYQTITASNGRLCVTASGSTRDKRAFLQEAGFRWDATRKLWWRYAPDRAA